MDQADNALRAAIKALSEVVAPALDPSDHQAAEQLQLVIHSLGFVRERLDYLHDRERFDVRHHVSLALAVADDADDAAPASAETLRDAVAAAMSVYERPGARTTELRAASAAVAAALRTLLRESADADPAVRRRIERRILEGSRERIDADRAWYLPQGFDPDPASALPLELALGLRLDE
jgi:hypothetical protein